MQNVSSAVAPSFSGPACQPCGSPMRSAQGDHSGRELHQSFHCNLLFGLIIRSQYVPPLSHPLTLPGLAAIGGVKSFQRSTSYLLEHVAITYSEIDPEALRPSSCPPSSCYFYTARCARCRRQAADQPISPRRVLVHQP